MFRINFVIAGLMALIMAGCASQDIPDPEPTDTTYGDQSSASTEGMGTGDPYGGEEVKDPFAGELQMIIYFDFDSSEVRAQELRVL